jgi:hypothetical protein
VTIKKKPQQVTWNHEPCDWKISKKTDELWNNDLLDHLNPSHCPTICHNINGVMKVIDTPYYDYIPGSPTSKNFELLEKFEKKKTYAEIACQTTPTTVKTRNAYVQTEETVVMSQKEYQRMIQRLNCQSPSPNWYPQVPFIPMFRPISPYM